MRMEKTMAAVEIHHMRAYCKRCDFCFGDPDQFQPFAAFEALVLNHACIPIIGFIPGRTMINDFLRMEYY